MFANKQGSMEEGGQDFCKDLSDLEFMNEPAILNCMRMRFCVSRSACAFSLWEMPHFLPWFSGLI